MKTCLGISITDKMIKYAKVQRNNDNKYSVTSYGVKFYDELKLNSTIEQIIQETNSASTPMSTNLRDNKYYYFNIFKIEKKDYIDKAVQTEFESFCVDNRINKETVAGRYHQIRICLDDSEKRRIMYSYTTRTNINNISKIFDKYNLRSIAPEAIALPNLININPNKNIMIIDLDDKTTVTTLIGGNLYSVDSLEVGMKNAFDSINEKENSYSKTYDVCKKPTIYTMEAIKQGERQRETENEYLKYIVPELYRIVQETQRLSTQYPKIDEIYLTGYGSAINNVDLYFQEYFKQAKVEILKPFFIANNGSVNIKDYIEVDSAIALAIQGMGYGIQSFNFKTNDILKKLKDLLNSDVSTLSKNGEEISFKEKAQALFARIVNGIKGAGNGLKSESKITSLDTSMIVSLIVVMVIIVMFSISSVWVSKAITDKINEAEQTITYTKSQETLANTDDSTIKNKTQDYIRYKTKLENTSSAIEEKRSRKNQITNLLSKIAYTIPKGVTLTSIKNTEQTSNSGETIQHIVITAKASEYEQLAYFKAKLSNAEILENVVSTFGEKSGSDVVATIEGDLTSY